MWTCFFRAASLVLAAVLVFAGIPAAEAAPTYSNSLGMEFLRIPAGTFTMGGDSGDSAPPHTVTITKPFYLGKYEVTQAQWKALLVGNPSRFKGDVKPVDSVSWVDVRRFIEVLNAHEGTTKYRLPTEAEWEYAARAGTQSDYPFGDSQAEILYFVWHNFNSGGTSHPVGMKKANAFGLHDMQGNVSEWVQDLYGDTYYAKSPKNDPQGPDYGGRRVTRGCSWRHDAEFCRSDRRLNFDPSERDGSIGFRLLREVE
ncbi:formylglycine-generating enzyme family protein [Desulfovibrio sp. OttesenSCG-928-M14]|nr:formylglycine-generating enzyme family protein [Desulfovibrio sp. OttesenSCG-928-M14]